jgi:hypothetical protein
MMIKVLTPCFGGTKGEKLAFIAQIKNGVCESVTYIRTSETSYRFQGLSFILLSA